MDEQNPSGQDRRAGLRVGTSGKVPGQIVIDAEANVVQISLGGVMAEVSKPLPVGSEHQLVLMVDKRELRLGGVVRNCRQRPGGGESGVYQVGIEFCELSETQRDALAEFVNKKLEQ